MLLNLARLHNLTMLQIQARLQNQANWTRAPECG
jgi:hypothetical protein